MKNRFVLSAFVLITSLRLHAAEFHPPQLVKAGEDGSIIATEDPGYAHLAGLILIKMES